MLAAPLPFLLLNHFRVITSTGVCVCVCVCVGRILGKRRKSGKAMVEQSQNGGVAGIIIIAIIVAKTSLN